MLPTNLYMDYQELTALLKSWAETHADRVKLHTLGQSFEGREIWCLTVTRFATGEAADKPAIWVDGNIHATEFSATSACLHLVAHLLREEDESVTEILDTRAFYVVPRICPDGAELAFAHPPKFVRSSLRPYPFGDPIIEGWEIGDVNEDGRILTVRIPDPTGPWKVCPEEPRLLQRRLPEDRHGQFYRCLPEGRFLQEDWDGVTIKGAPPKEGLDLNRNFPYKWRQESEQSGAGPFPASEPEVRAVVSFLSGRPNVCHAVTYHTFSGCFLRPYSNDPDEALPKEDLDLYKFFGERGSQLTGYPALCVYHDFRYHPKEVITGTFDDWAYEHLGVFAWTTEIWSAFRAAGLKDGFSPDTPRGKHRFITWFDNHPMEEELALLKWSDEKLEGRGYLDWQAYEHPQLGPVEIGGWDMFYAWRNPPPQYLEAELSPLTQWVFWMAQATPELALHRTSCTHLGDDNYRLELVVENRGWLPSYVTKKALERKLVRPVRAELSLGEARLVVGKVRSEGGQLEGRAYKATSPVWWRNDFSDNLCKFEWVVQGAAGSKVSVEVRHERCGVVRQEWILGA